MSKRFFVVVPFSLSEATGGKKAKKSFIPKMDDEKFHRCKIQLWQRLEFLSLGLRRCGLTAIPLTTPELIELFWALHHPKEAEVGYYPEIPPELTK